MAKVKKVIPRLSDELEELAYDMILQGRRKDEVHQALGFTSRSQFTRYQTQYPDFQESLELAEAFNCSYLEEEMLHVVDAYSDKYAKVKFESIAKILKYRNPKRYGDKIDMSVTTTIDIAGALDRAQGRMIDVTPLVPMLTGEGKE